MSSQSNRSAPGGDNSGGPAPTRRRAAVAAALLLMGAVMINPGFLDDPDGHTPVDTLTDADAMDEFDQIELMLAKAERADGATAELADVPAASLTIEEFPADVTESHVASPQSALALSDADLNVRNSQTAGTNSSPGSLAQSVSFPASTLQIPGMMTNDTQNISESHTQPAAKPALPRAAIRLVGTIDPIQ